MNTIKIDMKFNHFIAHRGLSGIETENSRLSFTAAGNRSYYGMECDIQRTLDGKIVVSHDDSLTRLGYLNIYIPYYTFEELQDFPLLDKKTGLLSPYVTIIEFSEYLTICKTYGKKPIVELKKSIKVEDLKTVIETCKKVDMLKEITFISFEVDLLVALRKLLPKTEMYLLTDRFNDKVFELCVKNKFGIDIYYEKVTEDLIKKYHLIGQKVNCFTVNSKEEAERLIKLGVDYITTDILE